MRNKTTTPPPGESDSSTAAPVMISLAPKFVPQQHDLYLKILIQAIDSDPTTRNLALTGAYGAGKSSVLQEVTENYPGRVVELSLSTLGKAFDPQASEGNENPAANTTTNRIQKEIVKQLLYQESPHKTPKSRFHRISSFQKGREVLLAACIAFLVAAFFFVTGRSGSVVESAGTKFWQILLTTATIFLISGTVVFLARWLSNGRMIIEKVGAGPATISLPPQSTSYFDEYLDEIIYYFEVSKRDIVIFEDIDRFDDAHIFETLRSLNTLLNGAKQLQNRPIRFIYALRDSVFERLGFDEESTGDDEAHIEIKRANRTKFFDLVIPVVPFLTHRNARDLMAREMDSKEYVISADLIDLAARHVADMRLIRNIRNEFEVFRRKLLVTESPMPGLDDNRLFAIILYKNIHMSDFENLRVGSSNLDHLYKAWRRLVNANIEELTQQDLRIRRRMRTTEAAEERGTRLAGKLINKASILARAPRSPHNKSLQPQIIMDNTALDSARMSSADFWANLSSSQSPISILIPSRYGQNLYLDFQINDLQDLIGEAIDPQEWEELDKESSERERNRIATHIDFLKHHEWQDLHHRPEFVSSSDDYEDGEFRSFRQLTDEILSSKLARDMVAHGYLNEYYALYVSPFYGELIRPDALNYVLHHVDRGEPEMLYDLDAADVEAIIRDQGVSVLSDHSMYNVSVLDYLLESRIDDAGRIVRELLAWGNGEVQFLDRYMTHGKYPQELIGLLAPSWPGVFAYVVGDAPVDGNKRQALFDAALTGWVHAITYNIDSSVREYIESDYSFLPSMTDPTDSKHAEHTMALVAIAGARLSSVEPLGLESRMAAISAKTYAVTAGNLSMLTGSEDIALDTLHSLNERIYDHVLGHLAGFVDAVHESPATQHTVRLPHEFVSIINDAIDRDIEGLPALIAEAAPACIVEDITDVGFEAWPSLAAHTRFPSTFGNVYAYFERTGSIDMHLARVLGLSAQITGVQDADRGDRGALAVALVNAQEVLPATAVRVQLVVSLNLDGPLLAADIAPESGELIGLLIKHHLLPDNSETFSTDLLMDWSTREAAIAQSRNFAAFMEPRHLPVEQLPNLMSSTRIPGAVKQNVFENLAHYTDGAGRRAYQAIANLALCSGWTANFSQIEVLRAGDVDPASIICLLARSSENISTDELREVLRKMGDNYAIIADPGTRRPTLPDTTEHRLILDRLKNADVVANYQQSKTPSLLRVSLKRK